MCPGPIEYVMTPACGEDIGVAANGLEKYSIVSGSKIAILQLVVYTVRNIIRTPSLSLF